MKNILSRSLLILFCFYSLSARCQNTAPCTICDSLVGNIKYVYNKNEQRVMISVVIFVGKQRFRGHFYSSLSLKDGKTLDQKEGWNDCNTFSLCSGGYNVSQFPKGTVIVLKVWGISSDHRLCKEGYNFYIKEEEFEQEFVIE